MKGLFYGGPGNLSDGSSLVTSRWGPKFGDGGLDAFQPVPTLRQGVKGDWQGRFKVMIEKNGEAAWHIAAEVANIKSCNVNQGADGNLCLDQL